MSNLSQYYYTHPGAARQPGKFSGAAVSGTCVASGDGSGVTSGDGSGSGVGGGGRMICGGFFGVGVGVGAHLKGRKVRKYRTLGLVLLVAIPLPGTGAWTGALVADVLDIRMRVALPAIAAGVVIAGCITTAVTCGVAGLM